MNELHAFKKTAQIKLSTGGRYRNPPKMREIPERMMKYELAQQLAKDVTPEAGMRHFCFLSGRFIAGDFLEAWIVEHNIHVKELTVSTLSMSEANIDSLANLINGGFVEKMNIVVSDYFFSHERQNLVPYMLKELDKEDRFQLAVCGTHCKLALIETAHGSKVVIHGSANLRSSGNLEHICIEENKQLYDFNYQIQRSIIDKYWVVKKALRHETLWNALK
jgi:hypothetical protein